MTTSQIQILSESNLVPNLQLVGSGGIGMSKTEINDLKAAARKSLGELALLLLVFLLLIAIPGDLLSGLLKFVATIWISISVVKFIIANRKHAIARRHDVENIRSRVVSRTEIARRQRESRERKEKQNELDRQRGIEAKTKHREEKTRAREREKLELSRIQDVHSPNNTDSNVGRILPTAKPFTEARDFGEELSKTEASDDAKLAKPQPDKNTDIIPLNVGTGSSLEKKEAEPSQYLQRIVRVNQARKNRHIVSTSCGTCNSTLDSSGFCRSGCRPLEE